MKLSNDTISKTSITYPWVYWDGAFTNDDLTTIISYCETQELKQATILNTEDLDKTINIRKSEIGFHHKNTETAWIFDKINFVINNINDEFYGFKLNGYNAFQYTTYDGSKNGKYDWHMDCSLGDYSLGHETRKLSLTLLLNDEFEGGEFELNTGTETGPIKVDTKKGRCILFPSFIIHRVKPVTSGFRKSLVVWCTGPKFI